MCFCQDYLRYSAIKNRKKSVLQVKLHRFENKMPDSICFGLQKAERYRSIRYCPACCLYDHIAMRFSVPSMNVIFSSEPFTTTL